MNTQAAANQQIAICCLDTLLTAMLDTNRRILHERTWWQATAVLFTSLIDAVDEEKRAQTWATYAVRIKARSRLCEALPFEYNSDFFLEYRRLMFGGASVGTVVDFAIAGAPSHQPADLGVTVH